MKKLLSILVTVIMVSGLVACGKDAQTTDEAKESAPVESVKEEITAAAVESTAAEVTTSAEIVSYWKGTLTYSYTPISDETKSMLIEKLTNLELVRGQEFDMNSLTFKDDELLARNDMKSILAYAMSSAMNESSILKCHYVRVIVSEIDCQDAYMVFHFKRIR